MADTFIFFPTEIGGSQQVITFNTAVDNITNVARRKAIQATLPLLKLTPSIIEEPNKKSYLNTPVYNYLAIGDPDNITGNNYINLLGEQVRFEPIVLFDIIMSVTQTKNIVKTAIKGRNGTIKEFISDGDYEINITGKLSGQYIPKKGNWEALDDYPEDAIKRLVQLCKIPAPLPVASNFFEPYGIDNVVINDYSFPQREGYRKEQTFTINMSSDDDVFLEFSESDINDAEKLSTILNV